MRVATYNTHDCIGRDRRYDPERIAGVVASLCADVVALQEVTLDHAGDVMAMLTVATGMQAVDGTLFERGVGRYGNVLLVRRGLLTAQCLHDLSVEDCEPRGLVDTYMIIDNCPLRVLGTHLGLGASERRRQLSQIEGLLAEEPRPTILLGDFNIWWGSGALLPLLRAGFRQQPLASFPSGPFPWLALDRVLVRGPWRSFYCWRFDRQPSRMASDHFPIVADLVLSDLLV